MRAGNGHNVPGDSSDNETGHVCVVGKMGPSGQVARLGPKGHLPPSHGKETHLWDHRAGRVRTGTNANIFVID